MPTTIMPRHATHVDEVAQKETEKEAPGLKSPLQNTMTDIQNTNTSSVSAESSNTSTTAESQRSFSIERWANGEFDRAWNGIKQDLFPLPDSIPKQRIKSENSLRNYKIQNEKSILKHIEQALKQYKDNQHAAFKNNSILFSLYNDSSYYSLGNAYQQNTLQSELLALTAIARACHKYVESDDSHYRTPPEPVVDLVISLGRDIFARIQDIFKEKLSDNNRDLASSTKASARWDTLKHVVLGGQPIDSMYHGELLDNSNLAGKSTFFYALRKWDELHAETEPGDAAKELPAVEKDAVSAFMEKPKRSKVVDVEKRISSLKNEKFQQWVYSEFLPEKFMDAEIPVDELYDIAVFLLGPQNGLTYLDATERKKYAVTIADGKFIDSSGQPFSTEHMQTRDGNGWAACVLAPDGIFYGHSHIPGKFHHSSFLSGGPVISAGTFSTKADGSLDAITPRTGHYKTDPFMFTAMLQALHRQGVNLKGVAARPDLSSPYYYDAMEVMLAGGHASGTRLNRMAVI